MSSLHNPNSNHELPEDDEDGVMLDASEAAEEIEGPDAAMDSGSDGEDADAGAAQEIQLENDSAAHFDLHTDSIFCIAQHPTHPEIVATGGGDDVGYIFDCTPPQPSVLPPSYQSSPRPAERESVASLFRITGHTDSLNALAFTLPRGEYLISAGLDGRLRAHKDTSSPSAGRSWKFVAEAQEVEEINWLRPCPHPNYPNALALGASDGSVWVYTVNAEDTASPLTIVQAFYLHTSSCTAGAWSPDGKLLATVSEDASLYVWDVFGEAAAAGVSGEGQTVVGLTSADQRFAVEGGLYSVAVSPSGTFAVAGGASGMVKVVGLPKISSGTSSPATSGIRSTGAPGRATSGRRGGGTTSTSTSGPGSQAGQILASLQAQTDGIETLSFSPSPLNLLATGSVDGSIALFDTAHRFAVRRHIHEAHDGFAVVEVDFVKSPRTGGWLLTSAGMDGVVRRWDTRGGTAAAGNGLVGEWKGHRGDGEGGGVLGFVQGGGGERVVTAGDE
jgi:ribosome assembly protein SQT1